MTKRLGSYTHEYTERDLALYALGLGCGVNDLKYVYECHQAFAALPTFAVIPAHPLAMFVPLEGYIPGYDRVSVRRGHPSQSVCSLEADGSALQHHWLSCSLSRQAVTAQQLDPRLSASVLFNYVHCSIGLPGSVAGDTELGRSRG